VRRLVLVLLVGAGCCKVDAPERWPFMHGKLAVHPQLPAPVVTRSSLQRECGTCGLGSLHLSLANVPDDVDGGVGLSLEGSGSCLSLIPDFSIAVRSELTVVYHDGPFLLGPIDCRVAVSYIDSDGGKGPPTWIRVRDRGNAFVLGLRVWVLFVFFGIAYVLARRRRPCVG
jgi:hypothetical protein